VNAYSFSNYLEVWSVLPFIASDRTSHFSSSERNAYRIDEHEQNVVILNIRIKAPCFTFICLDASNDCRCAGLLYQRGECIAMAREHNA